MSRFGNYYVKSFPDHGFMETPLRLETAPVHRRHTGVATAQRRSCIHCRDGRVEPGRKRDALVHFSHVPVPYKSSDDNCHDDCDDTVPKDAVYSHAGRI